MMESSSHKNIADSIIKIINETDNGMVIGLEGEYGSGKSTIIEIIEKNIFESDTKLKNQKPKNSDKDNIFIFKFDAWAHENNSLRRIFIETLINKLNIDKICYRKENITLDNFKNIISSKLKRVTTKRITNTKYAKIIGLSTLLVPLGMLLKPQDITILSGTFQLSYLIITLLTIAPFITSLVILFILMVKNKTKDKDKDKIRPFFEETIEQNEIFCDNDNTSIEFEEYFKCILDELDKKYKKILIIIDNLDRIDQTSVLKIWSTLQIFVQNNNNNIYTLIPFDHDRMKNVWFGKTINKEENNDSNNVSDSFFDKCFQLIIDVPKPIYSDISVYFKRKADEIFEDKTICDTTELLIRKFNKSNDNIFTPRKINNYINQIKMLQIRFVGYDINLKVIAFYAYKRTVANKSANELRSELIGGNLIRADEEYLFDSPEGYESDFASIIFGVKKETAKELLLTEQIRKALYEEKEKLNLIDIYKKNIGIFSKYLHDVIRKDSDNILLILKSSSVIKRTIDEGPDELKYILKSEDCIKQFRNVFSDDLYLPWPNNQQEIEQYINFVELISQDKEAIEKFHKLYIKAITIYLNNNENNKIITSPQLVDFIKKIMPKYMSDNKIKVEKVKSLNGNWFEAILIDKKNLEVFNYILPDFDDNQALELFKTRIDHSSYALNIIRYLIQRCPDDCKCLVYKVINFYFMYAKINQLSEKENTFKISLELLSHTINFKTNLTTAIEKLYNEHIEYTNLSLINGIKNKLIDKYSLDIGKTQI